MKLHHFLAPITFWEPEKAAVAVMTLTSDLGMEISLVNSSSGAMKLNLGQKFTTSGLGQSPVAPGRPHVRRR